MSNLREAEVGDIIGNVFIGGEMISCLRRSFVTTNSSKESRMCLPLKLVVPEGGKACRSTGGVVSLSPPVGEPRRAHCHKLRAMVNINNSMGNRCFILKYY